MESTENRLSGIETTWLREAALRIARRCRHIVQGCLREEEWADADQEFYAVILEELRQLTAEAKGTR